ncbi:Mbeg1-like protein [Thermophilibacter immobilis]|uniref:DUF2974 domain-containing protein n=1 Tax=Thermophilibacter immobilis TaxID=2779519 RepID=A0A7S7M907_9ACTN|nr:Mbeg1-like protein [Thermophilibacter immobilis]QOY60838.1 DUF2974 domain-containing protein [Thermophilibacter immobilis]
MDLFSYLERELATFDERPLGPVDSAALSQICMVDGVGVIPGASGHSTDAPSQSRAIGRLTERWRARRVPSVRFCDLFRAELFEGMFRGLTPERVKHELAALVASPRFRDLRLCDYTSVMDGAAHVQFSATTFVWHGRRRDSDFAYMAFRGTDNSLVGWRENFDMAVEPPVPAQRLAVDYLEDVARHLPARLYVGGHSKGGNLATYAALRCSEGIRARIERVFDHDGPGFKPGFASAGEFERLAGRIHRTVPEESVVGMIMETPAPTLVVRSTARGIDQHSIFTWEVSGDDFAYADGLSDGALLTHDVLAEWLDSLTDAEEPRVVEALFRAIDASGVTDARQVFSGDARPVALVVEAARTMSHETRDVLVPALSRLAAITARRALQRR